MDLTLRATRSLLAHFTYLIAYTIITEHTLLMGRSILRIVSETELRYLGAGRLIYMSG